MAKNRVIGANGAIPWHLPDELKQFKRITMGHHLIMGRKTWESIGRPLPGRTAIVVTHQGGYRAPGALVVHSLEEALAAGTGDDEIFVIGGSGLIAQALHLADRVYLTTVEAAPDGDTCMPEFDLAGWREVTSRSHAADERHAYPFRSVTYERVGR